MHSRRVLLSTVPWASCGCCCSVTESCPTLGDPVDCSTPGFPVLHYLPESVMLSNRLILCHPLLLFPSIFSSIKVFSNELGLCIRWPKYWSFSFNISPSVNIQGWFPLDWLVWSPCSPSDSQESSPAPQFESFSSSALSLRYDPTVTFVRDYWKNHSFDCIDTCRQSNVSDF